MTTCSPRLLHAPARLELRPYSYLQQRGNSRPQWVEVALGFMIVSNIYTTVGYFVHERIWARTEWGTEPTTEESRTSGSPPIVPAPGPGK